MKKNILIIEDDDFFRELISKKLVLSGFGVLEAVNGQRGLEKVDESAPDLVILDILLPNPDGFEVLATLKSNPKTSSIPVVIVSNLDAKEDIEKGLKLGASDFLVKSQFATDEIIAKIKSFI